MSARGNQAGSIGDIITDNLTTGAAVGGASFVVTYVMTYIFATIDGVEVSGQGGFSEVSLWQVVGWIMYGAHNVKIEVTSETSSGGNTQSNTDSWDIFSELDSGADLTSTIPEILYMVLPVAVLIGGGYMVYQRVETRSFEPVQAAALGATVTAGYLAFALVGRFTFAYSESSTQQTAGGTIESSFSIAPELTNAILLVGLVYPIIFGAIGGFLANQTE